MATLVKSFAIQGIDAWDGGTANGVAYYNAVLEGGYRNTVQL